MYDQEIENWYRPENSEAFEEDGNSALGVAGEQSGFAFSDEIIPLRESYFNADLCQPGSFGEMLRKHVTVEDMEAMCA